MCDLVDKKGGQQKGWAGVISWAVVNKKGGQCCTRLALVHPFSLAPPTRGDKLLCLPDRVLKSKRSGTKYRVVLPCGRPAPVSEPHKQRQGPLFAVACGQAPPLRCGVA